MIDYDDFEEDEIDFEISDVFGKIDIEYTGKDTFYLPNSNGGVVEFREMVDGKIRLSDESGDWED